MESGKKMSAASVSIRQATDKDFEPLLNFVLSNFLTTEPTSLAIGLRSEHAETFFTKEARTCLEKPFSYVAVSKNQNIVGVLLCSLKELRDQSEDVKSQSDKIIGKPNQWPYVDYQENGITVSKKYSTLSNATNPMRILDMFVKYIEADYKNVIPKSDGKAVHLHLETLCVDIKNYGRKGIASKLINICLENARRRGCEGATASALSIASQRLFKKRGFQILRIKKHKDVVDEFGKRLIKCEDGTNEGQLVYLAL